MFRKTLLPLFVLLQLAFGLSLNAENWIQIQTPPSWKQEQAAKAIQGDIWSQGSYSTDSHKLIVVVVTTPLPGADYAKAREFVEQTQHAYEVQKLKLAEPYPTRQLNLPGMVVGAYGNNLHNLSICLFTDKQAIQLNFFGSDPISTDTPKVKEFIQAIRLASDVQPAAITDEELERMTQPELKPAQLKRYAIYVTIALLALILLARIARRSKKTV